MGGLYSPLESLETKVAHDALEDWLPPYSEIHLKLRAVLYTVAPGCETNIKIELKKLFMNKVHGKIYVAGFYLLPVAFNSFVCTAIK